MQAQLARTDQSQAVLTSQQSLQSIQTLLKAGLGCITYLRSLLPSDNFSESYLTSSGPDTLSSHPSDAGGSFSTDSSKKTVSGFKIMTVTRGFTEEADRLLDYLENGIFDAIQKQYLRSFIFAVYLDNEDPNNVVETYTFNFDYHKIPETDVAVPIMSLDADLERLSLSGSKNMINPVSEAARKGRVPTLGEVKRSLKALVKNLITSTTQMDPLPKRRYATFKLFYYDHTPDDYEPPHFRPGDVKQDKWFFATHNKDESPERCSVGSLQTGHHSVNVSVTSVSGYLPSSEDNNAPFIGITNGNSHTAPLLTPAEEATLRAQQIRAQREDALERRVVWDADEGLCEVDADGEVDPDYVSPHVGPNNRTTYKERKPRDSGVFLEPVGIRDEEGQILPYEQGECKAVTACSSEITYAGKEDAVPDRIAQLAQGKERDLDTGDIMQTQQLTETQPMESPVASPTPSPMATPTPQMKSRNQKSKRIPLSSESLPPSDVFPESLPSVLSNDPLTQSADPTAQSTDTRLVEPLIVNSCANREDVEMLDLETQIVPSSVDESIHSFRSPDRTLPMPQNATNNRDDADRLECECGVVLDDCDQCMCEGGCKRWYHTWCMGYHCARDERFPAHFICFDCRVRADRNWNLIVIHDLYSRMIAKFKDLAIFRRAIKVCEIHNPQNLSAFVKLIGCDNVVAGQLFKRLETEGFIATETMEDDDIGLMETATRNTRSKKSKAAQAKRKKTLKKPRYVFIRASMNGEKYKDYFNPDPEVEKRVLALSELKPRRKSHKKPAEAVDAAMDGCEAQPPIAEINGNLPGTSQTQDESQLVHNAAPQNDGNKRKINTVPEAVKTRQSKRIKISVGPAVDLGD